MSYLGRYGMVDYNMEQHRKHENDARTEENGHGHGHAHGHEHSHGHEAHSPEEVTALLGYMVAHNRHHAEELHELAHSVEGEAAQLLHEAVVDLTVGNEKLAEALRILKGEE